MLEYAKLHGTGAFCVQFDSVEQSDADAWACHFAERHSLCAGCLDIIYVPSIANRKQGLEWLDQLGKGKHLQGNLTHLKKACAMIIEPYSPGEVCRR